MIGTHIGNYEVLERLGDGGMGTVYRAVDRMLDREVALKVMRPELSRQTALNERFRQEAVALARLNHPNIATVYGLERNGDHLVMVMEFIRGETLEAIVQRSGRLPWSRAFELGSAVLDALDHAHDQGVVHRDIKPANIMLTRTGLVKVMDFGIARILGRSRQTRVGAAVGTPMYMSPEQLRGEEVDGRSDLYSLGAVLYELMTGKLAFEADSDYELMMKQLNEPPPPVRATLADVPPTVDQILQRAMAKQREQRYVSASAMRVALNAALAVTVAPTPRAAPPTRLADVSAPVEREVPVSGVAITADHPVAPVAATRLATPVADVAPTRLSVDPPTTVGLQRWTADWRVWSAAAAVLLMATMAIQAVDGPESPHTTEAADTTGVTARKPELRPDPGVPSNRTDPAPTAGSGAATQLPSDPRVPGVRSAPPPSAGGVAPVAGQGDEGNPRPARQREAAPDPAPVQPQTATPPRQEPVTPVVPPKSDPEPPRPEPAPTRDNDSREAAERGVAEAVEGFVSAVNGGSADRVGALLRGGGDESQFVQLVREGRLKLDLSGRPDADISGGRATARFATSLNVRSAFGGNKRSSASFVAELSGSGDSWRVTSVRPVGRLNLK